MDIKKYFEMFKIFKIKGDPYIFVVDNNLFGIDENFESIYQIILSPIDAIPIGEFIACKIKEKENPFPNYSNIRIYNLLYPFVCKYAFNPLYQNGDQLEDNIAERVCYMKAGDGSIMINYHLDKDINQDYIFSLNYSLFPLAKSDMVDNYIVVDKYTNEIIMRSIIHKIKQKIDIISYHKFLNI